MILGAYEKLRKSGFLELPHRATLNQYTSFTSGGAGFNPDIIKRLYNDLKVSTLQRYEKQTILLFDGIKIKSGLVYSKSIGCIVRFTELGDINEELNELERTFQNSSTRSKELATYVICFMARGLLKRLSYPVDYFSSRGFTSDQLFPVTRRAIRVLEAIGLEVVAVVCDGATPNRKFFRTHAIKNGLSMSEEGVVYWVTNRYDLSRKIFFFIDPPHLIKTIRNNFVNSGGHNYKRNLMVKWGFNF